MIQALLECLPDEPDEPALWQVQYIAAACLNRQEILEISIVEQ